MKIINRGDDESTDSPYHIVMVTNIMQAESKHTNMIGIVKKGDITMANVKVPQDTKHELNIETGESGLPIMESTSSRIDHLVGGVPQVEIIDTDRVRVTASRFWARPVNVISLLVRGIAKVVSTVNRLGNSEIDSYRMKTRPDHSIGMRKWNL
jgi:hypothetical protein